MIWWIVGIYLSGAVVAWGVVMGSMNNILYDPVNHAPLAAMMACLSWLGVMVIASVHFDHGELGFSLWPRRPKPMATSQFSSYPGPYDMTPRGKYDPDWNEPTDAERTYALATMPGKATGHVIGYRTWGVRVDSPITRIPPPLEMAGMSQSDRWAEVMRLYQAWSQLELADMVRLTGVTFSNAEWVPGQPMIAFKDPSALSSIGHGPGIYALKKNPERGEVWGEVALWGDVVEHRDGYRARYAYPTRLYVNEEVNNVDVIAKALESAYGVPVEVAAPHDVLSDRMSRHMQQIHNMLAQQAYSQYAHNRVPSAFGMGSAQSSQSRDPFNPRDLFNGP